MEPPSLLHSTGHGDVDAVLEGVIGLYELLFPGRVSGYYLTGSFSDGSAIPVSDIDLSVLFRGPFPSEAEVEKVDQAAALCGKLSPVELDITPLGEEIPWPLRAVCLKLGSRLIYGEDARDRVLLPSMDAYVRHAMDVACRLITRLHRGTGSPTAPLDYPDSDAEFYGFVTAIASGVNSVAPDGTKRLVVATGLAATAILAFRAGRFAAGKREAIRLYREVINDEWGGFLEDLFLTCRDRWGYGVPQGVEERGRLRELCEQAHRFHDHFVQVHREYLMGQAG